jgi:hypothetical protein
VIIKNYLYITEYLAAKPIGEGKEISGAQTETIRYGFSHRLSGFAGEAKRFPPGRRGAKSLFN